VVFTVINIGFMVMMSAAGALGIKSASGISDSSSVIVGLYMCLFAAILAVFEIIQIYPHPVIDTIYKKNFGFLYGMVGKCGFLIFMAILCFGLVTPTTPTKTFSNDDAAKKSATLQIQTQTQAQQLAISTGALVGAWGIIQFVVSWKVRSISSL
jgi:hypothetical protein